MYMLEKCFYAFIPCTFKQILCFIFVYVFEFNYSSECQGVADMFYLKKKKKDKISPSPWLKCN